MTKGIKQLLTLLTLLSTTVSMQLFSQETNCNDGIDNDNNGFIDGFDPNCYTPPSCTVIGQEEDFSEMLPEIHCSYLDVLVTYAAPMVADIDNDDTVEIIVLDQENHDLLVINGSTCELEGVLDLANNTVFPKQGNVVLGDVDSNGLIDIFVAYGKVDGFGIIPDPKGVIRAEFNGTTFTTHWNVTDVATSEYKHLDIFDINQDGTPEIIPNGGFMLNSITGAIYPGALPTINTEGKGLYAFSAEADLGNNGNEGDVELILGTAIYRYDFVTDTWNLIREIITHNGPEWREQSKTALADLDLDGDLDAIITAQTIPSISNLGKVLAWDLQTNTIFASTIEPNIGTGRAAIGNFDNDPEPEFAYITRDGIIARDDITNLSGTDFTSLWTYTGSPSIPDQSAHTQIVLFDFDGDGKKELIHRGDDGLTILEGDGNAGNAELRYFSGANSVASGTGMEYPVVADVNLDGQANIITIGESGSTFGQGLHIFQSEGIPWRPARSIWNTQAYSVTNVNDDGTIPSVIQPNHTLYNSYLSQNAPFTRLPENEWVAPDLTISVQTSSGINGVINDNCPQLGLAIEVCNQGDFDVSNGISITAYDGDPFTDASAVYIGEYALNLNPAVSECLEDTLFFTPNSGTSYDFNFYVNQTEPFTGYPFAMTDLSHSIIECNYSNNGLNLLFSCNEAPEPENDLVTICSSATTIDVLNNDSDPNNNINSSTLSVTSAPSNGTVSVSGGQITYTPNAGYLGADSFEYSISDTGIPVETATATVNLTVEESYSTGTSSSTTLCSSEDELDLFTLVGSADSGGAWTDGNGDPVSNLFNPATDNAQTFTYSLNGVHNCVSNPSTAEITVITASSAGIDQTHTFCDSEGLIPMGSLLSGATSSSSGMWFNSSDVQVSQFFNTASSSDDVYYYVLAGTNPCPNDTAFITISTEAALDPGADNSLDLCQDAANVNLLGVLNNTPDSGGFWSDPDGNFHSGTLDPSTDSSGDYVYTHDATSNCPELTATAAIDILQLANPGQNNSISVCTSQQPFNLIGALLNSPDSGGDWTDPNGNPHSGVFNPSNDISGNYFYTIQMDAPCTSVSSFVSITVNSPFDPGINNSVNFCDADSPSSMLGLLDGTPDTNGSWSYSGSTISFSNFDPATHPDGTYTYTVPSNGSCPSDFANLNLTVYPNSHAGDDTTADVCNTDVSVDLTSILDGNPQTGGSWYNTLDESVNQTYNISAAGSYDFYYIVEGVGSCENDTSFLTLNVQQQLSAGADNSIAVCENEMVFDLDNSLSSDAVVGGDWYYPDLTLFNGLVDPGSDESGTYTYLVVSPSACPNLSANFDLDIQNLPNPGSNGSNTIVCENSANLDLFSLLNGTPQTDGVWTNPDNEIVSDDFSPLNQVSGIYTFTANSNNLCPNLTSVIQLQINVINDPGLNTSTFTCDNQGVIDLFTLLEGTPDLGGSWTLNDGSNTPVSGSFDTSAGVEQDFIYTHTNDSPCPASSSELSVSISTMTLAGADNSISICESDPEFDLITLLSPDAAIGEWICPNDEVLSSTIFTPGESNPGVHYYVTIPNAGCERDSAQIDVMLQELPNAGEDGFLLVCSVSDPVNLIEYLGGTPDSNGTWVSPDNEPVDPYFDPLLDEPGQYTYQVFGMSPCPLDASTASVNIVNAPNAGADTTLYLCSTNSPLDLNSLLAPDVTPYREWLDLANNPITPVEDPSDLLGNTYKLVAFGDAPCENDTSIHTVIVHEPVEITLSQPIILCSEGELEDLAANFEISNFSSLRFADENTNILPPFLNPSVHESQNAWIIVEGLEPCPADSLNFEITINDPANPGFDTSVDLCNTDPAINTFSLIEGEPDSPGYWIIEEDTLNNFILEPEEYSGELQLEYVAISPEPCPSYSSNLVVTIHQTPEPNFSIDLLDADITNPYYEFDNLTTGNFNYTWLIDDLDTLHSYNVSYTFPADVPETYIVCLAAENSVGCEAVFCDEVQVEEVLTYYIPNTFTPDGDGHNDLFFIQGMGIDEAFFEFYIFSRNGDLVFETTDLHEGWDGTWFGENVPTDIYAYRFVIKSNDSPERQELMGHITLMR